MLNEEIEKASRLVRTDAYQMSIGEIVNMYRDNELIINPDFQRLFRWEIGQKSKLIESILLGIPLPSIFVFEKEDSKWELVDGLQRMSTILEFMGELKDPDTGLEKPPISLVATKYLKSLNNVVWQKSQDVLDCDPDEQVALDGSQQIAIKRSRISVEILKRPSDNATKYDLFQRLNSGGTQANPQELRNCIVIMANKKYAEFVKELSENEDFRSVISLTDEQIEKQKHMEYVARFLVYSHIAYDGKLDVEEYIDEGILQLASSGKTQSSKKAFVNTFRILNEIYGEKALRRIQGGQHVGKVGLAAFECIAVGIAKNIDFILKKKSPPKHVESRIEKFWKNPEIESFFALGLRGTTRIKKTIPFGDDWFSK